MAFVVEDGTGLLDSNSFCSVEYADAYFNLRMNQVWASFTLEEKQSLLVQGTDFICVRWGAHFDGDILVEGQALVFPRTKFPPVPDPVMRATCEYAMIASNGPLIPVPEFSATGYQVTGKTEKIGPIEEKTNYAYEGPGSTQITIPPYPYPDMMLKPYFRKGMGSVIRN